MSAETRQRDGLSKHRIRARVAGNRPLDQPKIPRNAALSWSALSAQFSLPAAVSPSWARISLVYRVRRSSLPMGLAGSHHPPFALAVYSPLDAGEESCPAQAKRFNSIQ